MSIPNRIHDETLLRYVYTEVERSGSSCLIFDEVNRAFGLHARSGLGHIFCGKMRDETEDAFLKRKAFYLDTLLPCITDDALAEWAQGLLETNEYISAIHVWYGTTCGKTWHPTTYTGKSVALALGSLGYDVTDDDRL